jgi:hypothetical protein
MTYANPKTFVPDSDTSQRARSLARIMDRLEPGTYTLEITKPHDRNGIWLFELTQPVIIRRGELPKESVET